MMEVPNRTVGNILWDLPSEILRSRVFMFLNLESIARMDTAICNYKVREKFHLRLFMMIHSGYASNKLSEIHVEWIMKRSILLEKVSFHPTIPDDVAVNMKELLKATTSVWFANNSKIRERSLCMLINYYPRLTSLDLHFCNYITDKEVGLLTEQHVNLVELNLGLCGITTVGVGSILQYCTNLTTLDLTGCRLAATKELAELPWHRLFSLRALSLAKIPILSDEMVLGVTKQLPNLTSIDLKWNSLLTAASLVAMTGYLENLQCLSLDLNSNVDDTVLQAIALNCPVLRELSIPWCLKTSCVGVTALTKSCTQLQSLNLSRCTVGEDSLRAVAMYCSQLRKLDLFDCRQVTDKGVFQVAVKCTQLVYVVLLSCPLLTKQCVVAFPVTCKVVSEYSEEGTAESYFPVVP